jgi:hypothetical protein
MVQENLKYWLQSQTPTIWFLLNKKAQTTLPRGMVEYIGTGGPAEIEMGRAGLVTADRHLQALISLCSDAAVLSTYRRDLSGISTATQLTELLCEITLCASLAKLSPHKPQLRPPSGRGTSCDVAVQLAGHIVYCEAKRYADPWPNYQGPVGRSIFKSPPDDRSQENIRPRYMDLQSKLKRVPTQFPTETINILFVFHPSLAKSARYVQQSLFGQATFFMDPTDVALQGDGLFINDAWHAVSACYLSRVPPDGNLVCLTGWQNPRASAPVPPPVHELLDSLRPPSTFEGNRGL